MQLLQSWDAMETAETGEWLVTEFFNTDILFFILEGTWNGASVGFEVGINQPRSQRALLAPPDDLSTPYAFTDDIALPGFHISYGVRPIVTGGDVGTAINVSAFGGGRVDS
jgi:hypothetical protein